MSQHRLTFQVGPAPTWAELEFEARRVIATYCRYRPRADHADLEEAMERAAFEVRAADQEWIATVVVTV